MRWFERLALWAEKRGQKIVIMDRVSKSPYLERYYLHPRWLTLGLFRVVLHRFMRSDQEVDGLHDHPWGYISIPLCYGYNEVLPIGKGTHTKLVYRRPGRPIFARKSRRHRVELLRQCVVDIESREPIYQYGQTVYNHDLVHREGAELREWTLFIMGPRFTEKPWYFYIPQNSVWKKFFWKDWIWRREYAEENHRNPRHL